MLINLDWAKPMMQFVLHVTCSCISHAYVLSFQYTWYIWCCFGLFWLSFLSLPLLLFTLVMSMAPKRKSTPAQNPLHSGASLFSDPSPSHIRFRDDDAFKAFWRTSLDEAFIWNTKSFCWTLPTPTFPLSFTVGDGSHYVTSQSPVLSCLSRRSTPTCTRLII